MGLPGEDEDLEVLGVQWGRYSWTILITVAWVVSLVGWRYYPIPGFKPELWFLLGMGALTVIIGPFMTAFTVLLGAKRIQLGTSLMTINEDASKPQVIPWQDKDGVPVMTQTRVVNGVEVIEEIDFMALRTGGIAFLGIKGKDWAVYINFPGANVDQGAVRKIRVHMQPTPLAELPYPIKRFFVQGGAVILKGYNPKRSRIWFGLQPMTEEPIPAIHVNMDAAFRAQGRVIDNLERQIRRLKGLEQPEEGTVVRIIPERETGRGGEIVE